MGRLLLVAMMVAASVVPTAALAEEAPAPDPSASLEDPIVVPTSHGWDPYAWQRSPQQSWWYAWYTNALQTADYCHYHGLIPCGFKVYNDGDWFKEACVERGMTQYDVASVIRTKAAQALNAYGDHGITVHLVGAGSYPPSCYFEAHDDRNVASH